MTAFVRLTSLGGRLMVVRSEEIAFMATQPRTQANFSGDASIVSEAHTEIVLRSGEKGKCQETIDHILTRMAAES